MNNVVKFDNHNLAVVDYNKERWLTSFDVAKALGYEKTKSITNLYNNHKSEFDTDYSLVIDSMTSGKKVKTRIFNREGAWLIGMFARTPKAVEFRKWVLKVLGAVADTPKAAVEVAVREHTRALPTGKKEIVLSDKAKTEIGGIVKAVVSSAFDLESSGYQAEARLNKAFALFDKDEYTPEELRCMIAVCYTALYDLPDSRLKANLLNMFGLLRNYLTKVYTINQETLFALDYDNIEAVRYYQKELLHKDRIKAAA